MSVEMVHRRMTFERRNKIRRLLSQKSDMAGLYSLVTNWAQAAPLVFQQRWQLGAVSGEPRSQRFYTVLYLKFPGFAPSNGQL